jgi:hypothetical protein
MGFSSAENAGCPEQKSNADRNSSESSLIMEFSGDTFCSLFFGFLSSADKGGGVRLMESGLLTGPAPACQ